MITASYFREYRQLIGFSNQSAAKDFFGAKDIIPNIDYQYLELLNKRLADIVDKVHHIVVEPSKVKNIDFFKKEFIFSVFEKMQKNNIIQKLTNQGRRPEQVYYSWMRGYIVANYFLTSLSFILDTPLDSISALGSDDFNSTDSFKRTPAADFAVLLKSGLQLRLEIQSGFLGYNDIKQHKILEAKKIFNESGINSIGIHFDFYNGQVAFIKLNAVSEVDVNWITRQQMEGQTVFTIDQNYFLWKLTEPPPQYSTLSLD